MTDIARPGDVPDRNLVVFRTARAVAVAVAYLLLAGMLILLWVESQRAQDSREQIGDCIRPEGVCYQRGQQGTADAVVRLNDTTIAAAWCARQPANTTIEQVRACVVRNLGDH